MKSSPSNERSVTRRDPDRSTATLTSIREEAVAWISRRDAGLKLEKDPSFQEWLGRDPRNRAAMAEFDAAWSWLDRPSTTGAADDVLRELEVLQRRQQRRRAVVSAAAAAVVLVGASLWTLSRFRPGTGDGDGDAVATARVLAPQHQILPDGSMAELKTGAQIEVKYSPESRRIALVQGEALFHVKKDPGRPFVVEARGVELRAVGTAFAVQIDGSAVDVVVTEGRVAIDRRAVSGVPAQSKAPVSAAPLTPSQQATIDQNLSQPQVRTLSPTELAARLAWRATRLEFSGTPLGEVVALLNQYATDRNGLKFSIGDKAIAQVKVSGLYRVDNTAALLDLLDTGFGIVAETVGQSEIVLHKASARR